MKFNKQYNESKNTNDISNHKGQRVACQEISMNFSHFKPIKSNSIKQNILISIENYVNFTFSKILKTDELNLKV